MAQQMAPHPPHGKSDMTLCQASPLTLQQLLPSRVKVTRPEMGRRQETAPLSLPPLPTEFVDVGSSLTPSPVCHNSPAPSDRTVLRAKVNEAQAECGVPGREAEDQPSTLQRTFTTEGTQHQQTGVLTPLSGHGVETGTLVLGEELPRCVVVDLQGNMMVQEHSATTTPPAPATSYLVEEPILVQVSQEAGQTHQGRSIDNGVFGTSLTTELEPKREEQKEAESDKPAVSQAKAQHSGGAKLEGRLEFESRWNFREVAVKTDHPLTAASSQVESLQEEENEEVEEAGRPRRKSAKKARQRWKTIHDVEPCGKIGAKRARRFHFLARDKLGDKVEDALQEGVSGGEELPVWARRLSSVRVIESKWVVGMAASNDVLQQTLEAHSRSVLCDYIKSHPSSLEQRHRAKCQASRIMWHHQRIRFDGVPFTILSSNDLRCAFGMNYKLKRKEMTSGEDKRQKGRLEEELGVEEGNGLETIQAAADSQQEEPKNMQPKKKYKDIWFTSCPARITVKVIVKYPEYVVGGGALMGQRKVVMKALRRDLALGVALEREELYHVTLPLSCVHNHPLQGRSRGIHPSIDSKIIALLREGITTPKVIKELLEQHVEATTAGDLVVPHPDDRAYYPRLKDVANLVYTRCKRMGITAKRRLATDQPTLEAANRKKKRLKRPRCEEEGEGGCGTPLQASTLQEAVQTFCTEESERGSVGTLEGREGSRGGAGDMAGLAEMVRGQLDTLRSLTYSLQEAGTLQEVYQDLQVLINQYVTPSTPTLAEVPPATTFILQDPTVDPLATNPAAPCVTEVPDQLGGQERDGGGAEVAGKPRSAPPLRQLRPPVALQCLTTSMVPTLVSQLPRAPTHAPSTHMVTSSAPAPPTYQTLAPVGQDGPPPVHLSLPPYFYYVQEVTVPETSQTWTYSTPS